MYKSVVIVGSNGGIGSGLIHEIHRQMPDVIIHALARKKINTPLSPQHQKSPNIWGATHIHLFVILGLIFFDLEIINFSLHHV